MANKLRALGGLGAAVVIMLGLAQASADSPSNPDQADGPGIITIEQLNMCMWGSEETKPCFPNELDPETPDGRAEELRIAGLKRQSMVTQYQRHIPDVITVNEGCLNDLRTVADAIGYQLDYQETGGGKDHKPRKCTVDRGAGVNAIMAKDITDDGPRGYFQDPGWRSYMCSQVSTSEWPSVRVCTTHLSLKSQGDRQDVECAMLRDVLDASPGYVLFAGDVNMSLAGENCAPSRFHGLKDSDRPGSDPGDDEHHPGLQHIYYSANGFWRQSCGWSYTVDHTDHHGFLLELGTSAPDESGSCWRGALQLVAHREKVTNTTRDNVDVGLRVA